MVNASSLESGETAYSSGPPSENGGTSRVPGVRSFSSVPSALIDIRCWRRALFHSVQCLYSREVYTRAFVLALDSASSLPLLQASSAPHSGKTLERNTI